MFFPWGAFGSEGVVGSVGGFGAIATQSKLQSLSLSDGFGFGLMGGVERKNLHLGVGYQLLLARFNGGTAQMHSFRLFPGYAFLSRRSHSFLAQAGVGWQWTHLSEVDQVRQFEIGGGPAWRWNFLGNLHSLVQIHYIAGMYKPFQIGLQQVGMTFGLSYVFGRISEPKPDTFLTRECDVGMVSFSGGSNEICNPDDDGDEIPNPHDFCPNSEAMAEVDEMGCPVSSLARGMIQGIEFEPGSARLTQPSQLHIEKIAPVLLQYPNLFFTIEGYVSIENTEENLSEARAKTVMNHLLSLGVPGEKMTAKGYGSQYPLVAGRLQLGTLNDRIEIKWNSSRELGNLPSVSP